MWRNSTPSARRSTSAWWRRGVDRRQTVREMLVGIVMAIVLIGTILALSACATEPVGGNVTTSSQVIHRFPADMRLVCHEGRFYLGSPSAGEVVPLPFRCSEA